MSAGVRAESYRAASESLAELSAWEVDPKVIERLVHRIGQERIDARNAAVAAHQQLPLMQKDDVADHQRPCPAVAMVSVDGGRLQVRGMPAEPKPRTHWRESKTAVLETYLAPTHDADPDPDVPRCFLDLKRTVTMVRGLGHTLPRSLEFEDNATAEPVPKPVDKRSTRKPRPGRPQRLVRSVLASRAPSETFGPMVHQAAWERNFFGAKRRAFLGDGLPANWTIHRQHFSPFTPVLDFVHALSYLLAAAFAGRTPAEGEPIYRRWLQEVWSGRVSAILPELEARSSALGEPPPEASESDPRQLVFEAVRYLRNNADRMRYDEYRRNGLPIMTSAVESAIKRINRRVKGSEKFWSEPGAEAILQLRADSLSETQVLNRFWSSRETQASGFRPYRRTA
ncbi:MAG: hypothetical protein JO161_02000 [Planctomycetaceae bacterium]|nr:hypothetical protein [Planctomycetaceae bacterium]